MDRPTTALAADGHARCHWCLAAPDFTEYLRYHDEEWGFPVASDKRLFEKLCLEGFQSGLSWRTILAKRENFRAAFAGFEIDRVARFTDRDVTRLLADAGIVRHRGKIEAAIGNARAAQALIKTEGSLAAYVWRYEAPTTGGPVVVRPTSPESVAMSKDLKKRGWRFVGPTTVYAFMQSMGLVNDHAEGCVTRERVAQARRAFTPPAG